MTDTDRSEKLAEIRGNFGPGVSAQEWAERCAFLLAELDRIASAHKGPVHVVVGDARRSHHGASETQVPTAWNHPHRREVVMFHGWTAGDWAVVVPVFLAASFAFGLLSAWGQKVAAKLS